jgi:hypothetical protein
MKSYTCPMHPEIRAGKNDKCPKCGMNLVPLKTNHYKLAFLATAHCLTGCAIGEVMGMVLGNIFGWPNIETIIVSVVLAFFFGYSLTLLPLLRSGMNFASSMSIAFVSDTASITVMEVVDNAILFYIPGAMDASLLSLFFWGSLIFSLIIAFVAAFPVNMYLINKGKKSHIK